MEVNGHLHAQVALPSERALGTHEIGRWSGPRGGLDIVEEKKFLPL
jgi:hypothetical protein